MKSLRFIKVRKLYFPNEEEFKDSYIAFIFINSLFFVMCILFFPITSYLYFRDNFKGKSQIVYEEIKKCH